MSTVDDIPPAQQQREPGCSAIERTIIPQVHDLGGFSVRRVLPDAGQRMIGPWIFFDHMGPARFAAGEGIDVRPHPHINLATVTYLFEGEMLHRDSLGNELCIRPGEINLMFAGRGIVHSERQREEVKAQPHALNGLQLWLALPEADEEREPAFYHYDKDEIPSLTQDDVHIRVLIGSAYGLTSPVRTFADTLYIEAAMQAGQQLTLPKSVEQSGLYVVHGRLAVDGIELEQYSMSILNPSQHVTVTALEKTQLAVIGGERLGHRHIWWNFVSSRQQRIEQACADWKAGAFARIPGDELEFIPLPGTGQADD